MRKFRSLLAFTILLLARDTASSYCTDYLCDTWLPCWTCCTYPFTTDINLSYNYFRGLPNVSSKRNSGGLASINFGMPLWRAFDPAYAVQIGASYGIYDYTGRRRKESEPRRKSHKTEKQTYVTIGVTRKCPTYCGFNLGMVVDMMYAKNFTQLEVEPFVTQLRYQAGYLIARKDELGFWGTVYTNCAHRHNSFSNIAVHAVDQFNIFWSHYFAPCTNFSIWVGTPLTGGANKFIAGAHLRLPINECLSIEGSVGYMNAHRHRGVKDTPLFDDDGEPLYGKNGVQLVQHQKGHSYLSAAIGITYLFGCTQEYHCHKLEYCPYMMLGGNSNFFLQSHVPHDPEPVLMVAPLSP